MTSVVAISQDLANSHRRDALVDRRGAVDEFRQAVLRIPGRELQPDIDIAGKGI